MDPITLGAISIPITLPRWTICSDYTILLGEVPTLHRLDAAIAAIGLCQSGTVRDWHGEDIVLYGRQVLSDLEGLAHGLDVPTFRAQVRAVAWKLMAAMTSEGFPTQAEVEKKAE